MYVFILQLARHNKPLQIELEKACSNEQDPIRYYADRTAQIEVSMCLHVYLSIYLHQFQIVRSDRKLEQIVFPKNQLCNALTPASQDRVYQTTECDLQGSKVSHTLRNKMEAWREVIYLYLLG